MPSPIHIPGSCIKKAKNSFKSRNSNDIDVSIATLDEKIRRFQESFINASDEVNPGTNSKSDKTCHAETKSHFYPIPGIIETPTRPPMTPTINLNDLLSHQKQQKQQFFAPATPNSIISQTPSINLAQIPATPTCLLTPASTCTNNSLARDPQDEIEQKIMQELNEMFGEDEKDPVEDIFGKSIAPSQVNESEEKSSTKLKNIVENDEIMDSPVIDLQTLAEMKDPEEREKEIREKLMSSIWPCEAHHQRSRLRNVLSDIADRNFRKYEKVCRIPL